MMDLQNFTTDLFKLVSGKQHQANLEWTIKIQQQIRMNPKKRLEEILHSSPYAITNKNIQAFQEFINYFTATPSDQNHQNNKPTAANIQTSTNVNRSDDLCKIQQQSGHKYPYNQVSDIADIQKGFGQSHLNNEHQQLEKSSQNPTNLPFSQLYNQQLQQPQHQIQLQSLSNLNSQQITLKSKAKQISKFQQYKNQLKTYEQPDHKHETSKNHETHQVQRRTTNFEVNNTIQNSRNIVQQLQEMHNKEKERLIVKKSQLKKSKVGRIFKLNPQVQKKNQQLRKIQAQEKLKANIVFLDSIKKQQKIQQSPSFKQFKNFNSKEIIQIGGSLRMENRKRLQKLGFSDRSRLKISSTNLDTIFHQASWSFLPPIDKSNSRRPKPYSIYHINQKSNQIFYNK